MAKQPQPATKPEVIAKRLNSALQKGPAAFTSALMAVVKQKGMTAMAKQSGVSRHTLYRYEWGVDRPLLETAIRMTTACGFKLMVVPADDAKKPLATQ
jgi:probable addiction module antidote protein